MFHPIRSILFACMLAAAGTTMAQVVRYDDTDFSGSDLPDGHAFGQNYEQCAAACMADRRCVAFTASGTGCYKKSGASPGRSYGATSGFIASRGVPPPGGAYAQPSPFPPQHQGKPTTVRITRMDKTDFPRNDINELSRSAPSFDACADICVEDERCTAFSYSTISNMCFPKFSNSESKPDDKVISGIVRRR